MARQTPQGKREQAEALLAAINTRDFEALGEMPFHPDMEFHSVFAAAEGEIYHGIQGLREWAEAVDSTFDRFNNELIDFREVDDERAVVVVRATGQARASGVPVDALLTQIWTWRDGKMWRNQVFTDQREAFKAAGLSE
jgi:ketosteroid isomerase-like protein